VKKAEIIATVLKDVRGRGGRLSAESDALASERHLTAELEKRLCQIDSDLDLPTCPDFSYLGVECCPICHLDYPEYELAVVELESGRRAWLCCSLDRALNPTKSAAMERGASWEELFPMVSVDPA
jgi:hypothetical protein